MNLRKALLLTSLALVAVAFAVPATASADDFTHEGNPIEGEIEAEFSGEYAVALAQAPAIGVHCAKLDVGVTFSQKVATVTSFTATGCKTTHSDPAKDGLAVDPVPVNIGTWEVVPDFANKRFLLKKAHVTDRITHPFTPHLVIAENTFKGTIPIKIPGGQMEDVETVTLEDEGATVESPPGGTALEADVSGHLEYSSETQIGIAE